MKSYDELIAEQIEQFREPAEYHALPQVYGIWSHAYVAPGLNEVFETGDIPSFFANAFMETVKEEKPSFLSLGCGDGGVEIAVAKVLFDRGLTDFRFACYDLSEFQLERFQAAIPDELRPCFELSARDLNGEAITESFDAVMANHSLHHMMDLEGIFSAVWSNLKEGGIFVTNDMIGRNGHMRWEETKLFVDFFWPMLTERQRRNVLLQRTEHEFIDHDCSNVGFEGIRSEDILPLLLAQGFQAQRFFGFGGFIDPFLDRCFGHGFDVNDPDDAFLIKRMSLMNNILLDTGAIKPTMMLAWFVKEAKNPKFYRNRTAESAVRDPSYAPKWLAYGVEDFAKVANDSVYTFKGDVIAQLMAKIAEQESTISLLEKRILPIEDLLNAPEKPGASPEEFVEAIGTRVAILQTTIIKMEDQISGLENKVAGLEAMVLNLVETVTGQTQTMTNQLAMIAAQQETMMNQSEMIAEQQETISYQQDAEVVLKTRIADLESSTSWRVTAPLRALKRL